MFIVGEVSRKMKHSYHKYSIEQFSIEKLVFQVFIFCFFCLKKKEAKEKFKAVKKN